MNSKNNHELKVYLASRIRFERKQKKYSQKEIAGLASISVRTYQRFEQDCNGSIDSLINVLRVFDKIDFLENIFPLPTKGKHRLMKDILNSLKDSQ